MVATTLTTNSASPGPVVADPGPRKPSLRELFTGFLLMGLMGFGGVLPMARRAIVEERRWLTGDEFVEMLGLCQFLPGGNIMNLSVAVGFKFHRYSGALAGFVGLVSAPILIVIGLGAIYDRFQDDPHIRHLFLGLAAAAAGLLISMAIKIVAPLRRKPIAIAVAAICVVAITVLKLPLLPTMAVLAPVSMLITWGVQKW